MEKELSKLRKKIDDVDDQLVDLLRKRAHLASDVGKLKQSHNNTVFSRAEREAGILKRLANQGGNLSPDSVRAIYREIISACLACEKPQTISYLGPEHTFSHEAAKKHFGLSAIFHPADTIAAALQQAEKGVCDFAVVPFENSSEGTVGDTFDFLLHTPLSISGEIMLRVRHHLWIKKRKSANPNSQSKSKSQAKSKPAPNIKTIFAHPQALAQCRNFLARKFPQATLVPAESNSAAAQQVSEHGGAAIASQSAGDYLNLERLAANIEDSSSNTTRFFVFGAAQPAPSGCDKTSLLMTVQEKAGALYNLLGPFNKHGINMTKFQSRPSRGQMWKYVFYIDIEGHRHTPRIARALTETNKLAAFHKILGSYPRGDS